MIYAFRQGEEARKQGGRRGKVGMVDSFLLCFRLFGEFLGLGFAL